MDAPLSAPPDSPPPAEDRDAGAPPRRRPPDLGVPRAVQPLEAGQDDAAPPDPASAVVVLDAEEDANTLGIAVPEKFDFKKWMLAALPVRSASARRMFLLPNRLRVLPRRIEFDVELPDPEEPPCCATAACERDWEELRQLMRDRGLTLALVRLPKMAKPVHGHVLYLKRGKPCGE